ncbi:hypothetical protein MKQ70_07755 [Chitinophaga sedimenti]|uniref:hypothetical protein n=1 Tax=Chitinophaga sedimenti TaxID=2033606 RepID=UPI0020042937|nr:hypothetical protein [Chitinophaga sedimenti]MCK7554904.1 hypothetical protein [Chitinophaga sedimenti]
MAAVDAGFAPHVPWAMMYTQPPAANEVDGSLFMGLRYRIGYTSSKIYASKALGKLDKAFSANLFYWDDQPGDPVHDEVLWQQQQFGALLDNRVNVPEAGDASPKQALVSMLNQPGVTPLAVMYLYCHCSVGDGNTPVLRFGAKPSPDYTISRRELGGSAFADKPLVFANACTTAVADPYMANELAATFFRRDCRAYIGTEIKMPIVFASRFAFLFFNFFYRKIDPDPIAGGEAVAQSRVWLWTNYRNIGGLFYSYVNQYDLYMADEEEVKGMRRR